jgi:hypothetical protein
MLNKKWLKLASDLLGEASDEFSNHGCNDWKWPKDWSRNDRKEFMDRFVEEYDKEDLKYGPADFAVMSYLSNYLLELSGEANE